MKKILFCRCCNRKQLIKYLNLGNQPLANSYHKGEKLKQYPLEVMLCQYCFHSQLSVVVKPEDMFKNYLYVSGTTKTFRDHCKALAKDAIKRVKGKNISVLDIACNDGTQLEYFRDLGCKVDGVDPAENLRKITKKKNISVVVDYWTEKVADSLKKKFDIITGTNVFAHVHDLDEFLSATTNALKEDGILVLEFPYAFKMIENNEFDTVYHEHLSYFLINSFATLAKRTGFYIFDVLQTPIHGGSIRFFLKKGTQKNHKKIDLLIKKEKKLGLHDKKTYIAFANRVKNNKKNIRLMLAKLVKEKKKIIGYGASAKGNTMLNFFKINLEYIVDDNELKQGFFTPGRNIIINEPSILKKEKSPLAIIILSWNFYNEILKKIVSYRGIQKGDSGILYVPEIKQIPITKNSRSSFSA